MRRKKRVLIFPNTNTLSHVTRALTVAEWLEKAGYRAHIALSQPRRLWASRLYPRCHRILELWEPSGIPYPCLRWFYDAGYIESCVRSQERIIADIRPDLIVSVFDMVSGVSAAGIPRISINGYCMLPLYGGVLGFDDTPGPEREKQRIILDAFWAFAARAFRESLQRRKVAEVARANELLVGDRNGIYEIPELCFPQALPDSCECIGPLNWNGWEDLGDKVPWQRDPSQYTVYLNAGTLSKNENFMKILIEVCAQVGGRLLVSSGMKGMIASSNTLFCRPFLSPVSALSLADISICTGGVGSCYTNCSQGVPSLIVPGHPEQATNGLNLERAGCGKVAVYNRVFVGDTRQFLLETESQRTGILIHEMIDRIKTCGFSGLHHIRRKLQEIDTSERVLRIVGEAV